MTTKTKPQEPVLTEFFVTETYIIKAKTIDHANEMISENCFDANSVRHLGIDIQPNF